VTAGFRPCAILPSHNHARAVPGIVAALRARGLPVFVIDDGSDAATRASLAQLAVPGNTVRVARLDPNQGKGGAVEHGFRLAMAAGFTHALQIDADGQHDISALDDLLRLAQAHPDDLITGVPVYDRSVPLGRAIGRYLTHFWVWVETLSFQISDSMCGFRVYPLGAVAALLAAGETVGRRMDFDTEIMVRLFWRGVKVIEHPVAVTYPPGNTSNFDLWRDNLRITAMHTRLFFGMLRRVAGPGFRPPAADPSLGIARRTRCLLGPAGLGDDLSSARQAGVHDHHVSRRALFLSDGCGAAPCVTGLPGAGSRRSAR
jgi:glycosyltransferase involved in cell wall biosynthesis